MEKKVIKTVGGMTFAEEIAENMKKDREKREFYRRANEDGSGIKMKKVSIEGNLYHE